MSGFSSIAEYANADALGQVWESGFRKAIASAATTTNAWVDMTYFAGSPPANFYASSPLIAATIEADKGIYNGGNVAPKSKHLKNVKLMSAASSATSTTNGRQEIAVCDYLMYYPFIDTDAVGEQQDMVQTVSLPRYNTEAAFGPELVVNGAFDTDVSGWTQVLGTVAQATGRIRITADGASSGRASFPITCVVGKTYCLLFDRYKNTDTGTTVFVGIVGNGSVAGAISNTASSADGTGVAVYFTATQTNHYVLLGGQSITAGLYVEYDNISVREVLSRGEGGQIMCVAQSASSTVGTFTLSYTNQDGVAGRVSQNNFTFIVAGGGQIVAASGAGASYNPFCYLQAGDTAVRSIESVTFTAAGGGLMALVIVKPLLKTTVSPECRRTTARNLDSYGARTELPSVIHQAGAPRIYDGAVLGFVASGYAGSLASSILAGTLEVVWN